MKQLSSQTRRVVELARLEEGPDPTAASRVERSLAKRIALGGAVVGGSALAKPAAAAGLWATFGKSAVVAGAAAGIAFVGWEVAQSPDEVLDPQPMRAAAGVAQRSLQTPPPQTPSPQTPSLQTPSPQTPSPQTPPRQGSAVSKAPMGDLPAPQSGVLDADSALATSVPKASAASVSKREVVSGPEPELRTARSGPVMAPEAPRMLSGARPETQELDRLAMETRELREAQQALRNGDSLRALGLLEQQDVRHAAGALAQERHAARVLALCQSGQVQRAREAAEQFERRFPRSALLGRVRSACSD